MSKSTFAQNNVSPINKNKFLNRLWMNWVITLNKIQKIVKILEKYK